MGRDYPRLIAESSAELRSLERQHRGRKTEVRVRMLCWLKEGEVRSREQAARMLGYSGAQVKRWWQRYEAGGLEELLTLHSLDLATPPGKASFLTEEAWAGLAAELRQGRIHSLEEAR